MDAADYRFQAEKLMAYIQRGGDNDRWFNSKDFTNEQRIGVEAAYMRLCKNSPASVDSGGLADWQ